MDTIRRKSLIYKSGIGFYCLNHVQGCSHGCRYPCYAFMMAQHYGRSKSYADWCRPKLVANALELADKELPKLAGKAESIHLCLTTDPFMTGYLEVSEMSLNLIARINAARIPVTVLTKGALPEALGDTGQFLKANRYGISLVSQDEKFRKRWEPHSAPYAQRIAALKCLHGQGFKTYVHIEPYPTPNIAQQDIRELLAAVGFVDEMYFSGWNYNPQVRSYPGREEFYKAQGQVVEEFCRKQGIEQTIE